MSKVEIYVEFEEVDDRVGLLTNWFVGRMYTGMVKFRCEEKVCGGCRWLECGKFELFNLWKLEIEDDINMFDLAMSLGLDMLRMSNVFELKARLGVCKGDECVDVNLKDIEKWWEEEVWDWGIRGRLGEEKVGKEEEGRV
jgi:hypothetical protein